MIYPQSKQRGPSWAGRVQLAFATLGAPLAWFIHSLGIVLLVPTSCDAGSTFPHWIVTGAATGLSLAALGVAWRIWRVSGQDQGQPTESQTTTSTATSSRSGFLSWGGVFISIMFLLLILIESIPLAWLGACEPHP